MKRLLIITLSIISSTTLAIPVLAQPRVTINTEEARRIVEITPYDLVTSSYQGRFRDRGIPAAGGFISAINSNRIKAQDLVKVAIAEGRLSESTLKNKAYLHNVRSLMKNLDEN